MVYVIGHKNPDTDAICAAVAYADFLKQTRFPNARAAACGPPNQRTQFVLKAADLPAPEVLINVQPTAALFCEKPCVHAQLQESFWDVYRRMERYNLKSIPILDGDRKLVGLASLLELLYLLIPSEGQLEENRSVNTKLQNICEVLKGEWALSFEPNEAQELNLVIGAMSAEKFMTRLQSWDPASTLLVTGDRPTIQKPAIDYGVRCLIVTGGFPISEELKTLAEEKKVSVIISPYDTATTAQLIKGARLIDSVIRREFLSFKPTDLVSDLRRAVAGSSQHVFPVVNEQSELVGLFSKADLVTPARTQLVLVDHNEYSQAVSGVEDAEILEVIDHHKIGGQLRSNEPIRFINDPVGSTCTIVARMYRDASIAPTRGIALCMAAGIISDTLNLQSPTATDVDRDILNWLARYGEIEVGAFAVELFQAGSTLAHMPVPEVIKSDCKFYQENSWSFSISQVEELGLDRFWERKPELVEGLEKHKRDRDLDFACLFITDITLQSSLLLTVGEPRLTDGLPYPSTEPNLFKLSGVVSRKKQLLPPLLSIMTRVGKTSHP